MSRKYSSARALGYRSGLETSTADNLKDRGVSFEYEKHKIKWVDHKIRTYTPDFILENGIVIETKGYFKAEDRRKHLEIKEQYPHLDIRFVFTRSSTKLSKKSKTTYGMWCEKNDFLYADIEIPQAWLDEPKKKAIDLKGLDKK